MTFLSKLAGFTALPVIASIMPLAVLPIVARLGTESDWVAVTLGQAVGAFAASAAFVGWNIMGTALLAQTPDTDQQIDLYVRSFWVRGAAIAVLLPVLGVAAGLASPDGSRLLAVYFCVASGVGAFSVSWYGIGTSSPWLIARYEVIPRLAMTVVSIPLMIWTGRVEWYPAALLLGALLGLATLHWRLLGRLLPPWAGWRAILSDVRAFRGSWSVELLGNAYSAAPVPVAATRFDSFAAASYSSADKLYRFALFSVLALGNAFQGWVLSVRDEARARRNLYAILAHLALGGAGGLFMALLGPWASSVLFGSHVRGDPGSFIWLGVAFFFISSSTPFIRNVLMPAGCARVVATGTLVGAVAGLGAMFLQPVSNGVSVVAAGLAVSELIVLVVCVAGCVKRGLWWPFRRAPKPAL